MLTIQVEELPYNFILGLDLLTALRIVIDFVDKTIKWENSEITMKTGGTIHDPQIVEPLYLTTQH